jgi:hypothetical protein
MDTAYAERAFPLPPLLTADADPEQIADRAALVDLICLKRRVAATNTVTPCPECQPALLARITTGKLNEPKPTRRRRDLE